MPSGITGDTAQIAKFIEQVGGMKQATKKIGKAVLPKLEGLIEAEFSSSTGPYGQTWQPKKDGGAPFVGHSASKRVKFKLLNEGRTIRTTVAYPMHFHQDGTFSGGRKTQRRLRKKLRLEGFKGRALKAEVNARIGERVQHDPARPIIPDDAKGIPAPWGAAIVEAAVPIMAAGGATPAKGK